MLRNSADTLEEVPALLVRCRGDGEIVAIFHGTIMGNFRPLVSARLVGDGTFPNDLWRFIFFGIGRWKRKGRFFLADFDYRKVNMVI